MKNASAGNKETNERLEMLRAEAGHLLMTSKNHNSADQARLRMLDAKIKSLSGHWKLQKTTPSE